MNTQVRIAARPMRAVKAADLDGVYVNPRAVLAKQALTGRVHKVARGVFVAPPETVVDLDQVRRDHVISHVLAAISTHAPDTFLFTGGTMLSRTWLRDVRLSEDIDLMVYEPRNVAGARLADLVTTEIEPLFGTVEWDKAPATAGDAEPILASVGADVTIKFQLVDTTGRPPWARERVAIHQRYSDARTPSQPTADMARRPGHLLSIISSTHPRKTGGSLTLDINAGWASPRRTRSIGLAARWLSSARSTGSIQGKPPQRDLAGAATPHAARPRPKTRAAAELDSCPWQKRSSPHAG